ncbi:MAG: hypothetical protein ABSC51_03635 [Gaiellaceae bacterium]
MSRLYVLVAALVVAIVVALGTYTVTRSSALGPAAASTQNVNTLVAQGNQRLTTAETALNQVLAQQPPAVHGGSVPFVTPHPVVVNVSGAANAVPYTPQPAYFGDEGGNGD